MNNHQISPPEMTNSITTKRPIRWPLLIVSSLLLAIGIIGGPLLSRLYYLHGGNSIWVTTCMQAAGFPVLFFPLIYLFFSRTEPFAFLNGKLFVFSSIIGVFMGLDNFMYSLGISYIPVSTSSLLYSTQLAFTALFAWVLVKHKFTAFSINSVVLMTLGAAMLGLRTSSDRPEGVTNLEYFSGFFLTLGSAALLGLMWPCVEKCYVASSRKVNYQMVLQFQLNLAIFATIFSVVGLLISKDYKAIGREADEYGLGSSMYYVVLAAGAVVWQCSFLGSVGVIYCTSSLFNGVAGAVLLPFTEVAAVIAYHETFNGEKAMSLALCLWGFTSYFYGEYKLQLDTNNAASAEETTPFIT